MQLNQLCKALVCHKIISRALQEFKGHLLFQNFVAEARPVLVAGLYLTRPQKILVCTSSHDKALKWQARLKICGVPEQEIRLLPSGISALFEDATPETVALSERLGSLEALYSKKTSIVVATAGASLERTLPIETFEMSRFTLELGQTFPPEKLLKKIIQLGYEYTEPVQNPGHFSKRGGILDIYPIGKQHPVRIEFFGDQIESIRKFDAHSQRSLRQTNHVHLVPARETLLAELEKSFSEMLLRTMEIEASLLETEAADRLRKVIQEDCVSLESNHFFDRLDLYRPLIYPDSGSSIHYLGQDGLLILDEPSELEHKIQRSIEELTQSLEARSHRGEILKSTTSDYMLDIEHFGNAPHILAFSSFEEKHTWLEDSQYHSIHSSSLKSFIGQPQALLESIQQWKNRGTSTIFGTDQPSRTRKILAKQELFLSDHESIEPSNLYLAEGNLAGGFILPELGLAYISDQELYGAGRLKLTQKRFREGLPITTLLDLKDGDYVVHIHFGIGVFRGLTQRTVDGIEKEYLYIDYAGPDKLFVPADQLDRIQKYLNPGEAHPKINRISSKDWKKTIAKAREDAEFFAKDLIKIYAERKKITRPSLGPDTPWQKEMETTFPWVETPSQLQAIREVKEDLASDFPMDRLICGDVGFGKTEVAIRAAFKVAQSGKQVALICPTTILSEQHFRSFEERLAGFPICQAILNRFKTPQEKKKILEHLENGKINLIVGTHSLLGKGIKFKNLGLIIIDEEQKFGVKQKELLKSLRANVDVLAMSATPIPRTLSMALMDIRQLSLINDPPPGRLAVRTFVRPYSKETIIEAVLRELSRGGQIYYVYNRVQGIYHIAEKLQKMVPSAKVGVAHGQMNEKELEPIMVSFIKGDLDILLSTSIIESGIDIPSANTLIVESADKFGLAQLYQLRGRVGRSDRQAYAYFLYENYKALTENANARLKSLQEFSQLGAGYSLAFRDLQIRGAGELLGAKQHGTMATVGYELYTQLIEQEIENLKAIADGKEIKHTDVLEALEPLPTIDLPVSAHLPQGYIEDQAQRLYYYKKLMSSRSRNDLTAIKEEIVDRYGKLPLEANNAFEMILLRLKAKEIEIKKISCTSQSLKVQFEYESVITPRMLSMIRQSNPNCSLSQDRLIWPFSGSPLSACDKSLQAVDKCFKDMQGHRVQNL